MKRSFQEVPLGRLQWGSNFPFGAFFMLVMCVHTWSPKTPGMTENAGAHFFSAIPSRDAESHGTALDEK